MSNALSVTGKVKEQRFHEHDFYGRHAFFVAGRYVQIRFKVIEPKAFPDPRESQAPNARLDAVADTVASRGLKFAMFVTELPHGADPALAEQEGWEGFPEKQLGVIEVPRQLASSTSAAHQWMLEHPHLQSLPVHTFHAVGLGRHRVPIYEASGKFRNEDNAKFILSNAAH
jgi:hypothetical protein